jgi:hypothetical protein
MEVFHFILQMLEPWGKGPKYILFRRWMGSGFDVQELNSILPVI